MLKSISVWAFSPERPLPEVFQLAKQHGFDGVEVAIALDGPITPDSTQDECDLIRHQASAAGIQLAGLAAGLTWRTPLSTGNLEASAQYQETIAKCLQVGQWLGVDAMLVIPGVVGDETEGGTNYEDAYRNSVAAFKRLKTTAEATGVSLAAENVWNKFLLSPLEFRSFLDEINSPKVGCYFDVGNLIIQGFAEQWIRILGTRIHRVHFKDFQRSVGNGAGFCDLLDGDVNYPEVMKALRQVGYNGPVTAEFFDCEADLPKISAATDKILGM